MIVQAMLRRKEAEVKGKGEGASEPGDGGEAIRMQKVMAVQISRKLRFYTSPA